MKSTLFILFFFNISFAQSPWTLPRLIDDAEIYGGIQQHPASIQAAIGPQRELAIVAMNDPLRSYFSLDNGRTFAKAIIDTGWYWGWTGEYIGPIEAVGFDRQSQFFVFWRKYYYDDMVGWYSFRLSKSVNAGRSFSPFWKTEYMGGTSSSTFDQSGMHIDEHNYVHCIWDSVDSPISSYIHSRFSSVDSSQRRQRVLSAIPRGYNIEGGVHAHGNSIIVVLTSNYHGWQYYCSSLDSGITFSMATQLEGLYHGGSHLLPGLNNTTLLIHTMGNSSYDSILVFRTFEDSSFSSPHVLMEDLRGLGRPLAVKKRGSEIHVAFTRYSPIGGVAYYRLSESGGMPTDSAFLPNHNSPALALDSLGGVYLVTASERKMYLSTKDVVLDVSEPSKDLPRQVHLAQNYPNPFNPTTAIAFDLPRRSDVSLVVYDVLGRQVERLVNEERDAGRHSLSFDASHVSSCVYFYRLVADGFVQTKKMIVQK